MEEAGQDSSKNRIIVMICDDDQELLNLFQREMGSKYSVIAVDSGIDCISRYIDEKVKGNKIDVLIVNYDLHDLPGDIVATTIRDLGGSSVIGITKTILLSASGLDRELVEDLKSSDCVIESVRKPVSVESLMKIIETAISGPRS